MTKRNRSLTLECYTSKGKLRFWIGDLEVLPSDVDWHSCPMLMDASDLNDVCDDKPKCGGLIRLGFTKTKWLKRPKGRK